MSLPPPELSWKTFHKRFHVLTPLGNNKKLTFAEEVSNFLFRLKVPGIMCLQKTPLSLTKYQTGNPNTSLPHIVPYHNRWFDSHESSECHHRTLCRCWRGPILLACFRRAQNYDRYILWFSPHPFLEDFLLGWGRSIWIDVFAILDFLDWQKVDIY